MNTMIKPVSGRCNLDCRYCFYKKDHDFRGRMSVETACRVIDSLSVFLRGGYPLVFQGGEPLLAGHRWFEEVFAYLDAKGLQPDLAVQTNGTLLDDAYGKMFGERHVLVGVSLDGTEKTHSLHRADFSQVMRGIRCLRRHGCEFNILTVVTDELCADLPEVYEFYRREGFEFQQYIPCMAPKGADPCLFLSEKSYGSFLTELYDLWRGDFEKGRYVYIRYFENLLQILGGFPPEECGAAGVCSAQFLVEYDGNVYPCDFYVEDSCRLGNVWTDSPKTLAERLEAIGFIRRSRVLPDECRSCEFVRFCRGGCRRYRKEDGRYIYCNAIKPFLIRALPDMKKLLE